MKAMKNKTVVYLIKDKDSAALKRAATHDYFGEAEISYLENGKPIIKSPEGYHISVSHSGTLTALVISDLPIGIDIERVREFDFSRLKERFLSEKEREAVLSKEDFFKIWVKKEAEAKIEGGGVFAMREKDATATFSSISEELSSFAGEAYEGTIASFSKIDYTVRKL